LLSLRSSRILGVLCGEFFSSSTLTKSWCGRGDLNYSITLITRNLLILHSA
jgi:hypothetical protein